MASATATKQNLRMSAADAKARWQTGQPMTILDSRSDHAYQEANSRIKGDIRVDPNNLKIDRSWPKDQLILVYCT